MKFSSSLSNSLYSMQYSKEDFVCSYYSLKAFFFSVIKSGLKTFENSSMKFETFFEGLFL